MDPLAFELPAEVRAIGDLAREFVDRELIPREREIEEGDDIPAGLRRELEERARAVGLWALDTPERWGGAGLTNLAIAVALQEHARSILVPFRAPRVFGPEVGPLFRWCTPAQIERWVAPVVAGERRLAFAVTEPEAGSDPSRLRTRASACPDGFRIDGGKRFITSAATADLFLVVAVTDPEGGTRDGFGVFFVERGTPGLRIGPFARLMIGETPGELSFDGCVVPPEALVGGAGRGWQVTQDWLGTYRLRHGPRAVGVAGRALRLAAEYANQRQTFGRRLAEHGAVQTMLADSAIELAAARLLCYEAADRADRGEDVRAQTSMVKVYANEVAYRIVDRAIQIHGGTGLTRDLPLERMFRDLRTRLITEGPSEVHRMLIARDLCRQPAQAERY